MDVYVRDEHEHYSSTSEEEEAYIDYPSTEETDTDLEETREEHTQVSHSVFEDYERLIRTYKATIPIDLLPRVTPVGTFRVSPCLFKYNTECSICLETVDFRVVNVGCSSCGQCFHSRCIEEMYRQNTSKHRVRCPMCRATMDPVQTPIRN